MSVVSDLLWSDLTLKCSRLEISDSPLIRTWLSCWDSDCLYDYVNEVRTYNWLVGCVGWNQWTSVDSQVLLESIYWLSCKCREVMDPFDLLLLRPMSIPEANIDRFKQSVLIEARPLFLMVKEWNGEGSDFYPHNKEKSWIRHCCLEEKYTFFTVMGTVGGSSSCTQPLIKSEVILTLMLLIVSL